MVIIVTYFFKSSVVYPLFVGAGNCKMYIVIYD